MELIYPVDALNEPIREGVYTLGLGMPRESCHVWKIRFRGDRVTIQNMVHDKEEDLFSALSPKKIHQLYPINTWEEQDRLRQLTDEMYKR